MRLSENWFIEGYIDFELQKYRLLAYLKEVEQCFNTQRLYPQLSDVIFHYNNLVAFRENKKLVQDNFPATVQRVDVQKLELVYKRMLDDDETMQELERITSFATGELKNAVKTGAEIYEMVERNVSIEPVGIVPIYKDEGYMLLLHKSCAEIKAYYYAVTLFEHYNARYKAIKMDYIDSWAANIVNTFTQVKKDIIRTNRLLPNPAVYSIQSALDVPFIETLLPVAKRMLMKQITIGQA